MSTWLLPRIELTPEQLRAVEFSPTESRVVLGLPGSGKTQVMLHRADYLRNRWHIPPDRFRIFVFTNVLRNYIRAGLEMLDLPIETVCTFDSWCRHYYDAHIATRRACTFPEIRTMVLQHLQSQAQIHKEFDFVLVDEGQDLTAESFRILRCIANHITVFADYLQQIYEDGVDEHTILASLGLGRFHATLLGAYRNSPAVARLAASFIADLEKRHQYLAQTQHNQPQIERPLLFIAPSFEAEIDRLAAIIRQRQMRNERVGILVPQNRQVHGIAQGLDERGVLVERAVSHFHSGARTQASFDNIVPKIASYHSAKGLTFDSVLLPRLTDRSFTRFHASTRRRLLFVGITRATHWVYLSTVGEQRFHDLDLLTEAHARGDLTIQHRAEACLDEGLASPEAPEDELSIL